MMPCGHGIAARSDVLSLHVVDPTNLPQLVLRTFVLRLLRVVLFIVDKVQARQRGLKVVARNSVAHEIVAKAAVVPHQVEAGRGDDAERA